jgi:protein-disulfide isomerase
LVHSLGPELKLDVARFAADLEAHRYLPRVKRDFMGGMRSGVAATPTFFINAERYEGTLSERALLAALLRASP